MQPRRKRSKRTDSSKLDSSTEDSYGITYFKDQTKKAIMSLMKKANK